MLTHFGVDEPLGSGTMLLTVPALGFPIRRTIFPQNVQPFRGFQQISSGGSMGNRSQSHWPGSELTATVTVSHVLSPV